MTRTHTHTLMTSAVLALWALGCQPPEPKITLPGALEPVPGEDNFYYSRRDNVELTGRSRYRYERMFVHVEQTVFPTSPDYPIAERISYQESFPDAVFMRVTPAHAADSTWGRWLTGELLPPEDGSDTISLGTFQFPRLLLNMGERVNVVAWSAVGRNATGPVDPLDPAIGMDREAFDTVDVALHPDVLLVPVHFRVFADEDGVIWSRWNPVATAWLDEGFVRSIFDPGLVTEGNSHSDAFSSSTFLEATERPRAFAPDEPFATCGVQFRLDSFRVIRQTYGIEETAFTSCDTLDANTTPLPDLSRPPLSRLVAEERLAYQYPGATSIDQIDGIDIYVTGRLRGQDAPNTECGDRPGAGYYRSSGGRNNPIWISNEWLWFGFANAISHEIGHRLLRVGNSGHVSDASNVMSISSLPQNTTEVKSFTEEQCALIREHASVILRAAGRIP